MDSPETIPSVANNYLYQTSEKVILAGKTPYSKHVPSGPESLEAQVKTVSLQISPTITQSHSKKLSSVAGPAIIPSGGLAISSTKIITGRLDKMWVENLRLNSVISRFSANPAILRFFGKRCYS